MAPVIPESQETTVLHRSTSRQIISNDFIKRISAATSNLNRRTTVSTTYNPGQGIKDPTAINNKAYFSLFALLGAAMVLASIWFFFWAKNGGFVWRQGDWDDYKSTVLRRKGKDGKTLSNATKSTKLGHESIAGTFTEYGRDEKVAASDYGYRSVGGKQKKSRPHGTKRREPSDDDVRAYRYEKPALVGGLNRQHDGSHFDYTNSDRSELSARSTQPLRPKSGPPKKKGFMEKKREKREVRKREKRQKTTKNDINEREEHFLRRPTSTVATSTIADSEEFYGDEHDESYYTAYRPCPAPYADRHESPRRQSPHHSRPTSASHPRQSSPLKHPPKQHGGYAYSEAGSSDAGTKAYPHYIPELTRGNRETGYRRDAFGGRRDSLSDSDGDLGSRRY